MKTVKCEPVAYWRGAEQKMTRLLDQAIAREDAELVVKMSEGLEIVRTKLAEAELLEAASEL